MKVASDGQLNVSSCILNKKAYVEVYFKGGFFALLTVVSDGKSFEFPFEINLLKELLLLLQKQLSVLNYLIYNLIYYFFVQMILGLP